MPQAAPPISGGALFGAAQLSSSPVERHHQPQPHSRQHSRQQSTTSATSGQSGGRYHQRQPSGPPSPLAGSSHGHGYGSIGGDLPRPWMTGNGRSRGGSSGSQSSDQGYGGGAPFSAIPSTASAITNGGINAPTSAPAVPGGANVSPSVWHPAQPSLLGPRARSGSRSRAGPGAEMGMMMMPPPVPPPSAGMNPSFSASSTGSNNAPRSTARDQVARFQPSASGGFLAADTNAELLSPSPTTPGAGFGGRTRNGSASMARPSPLGTASHHQRRQHGGSDPTLATSASLRPAAPPSVDSDSGSTGGAANGVLAASPLVTAAPPRPLDLWALHGKDDVHAHLERTVDDLARWLDALAGSLAT